MEFVSDTKRLRQTLQSSRLWEKRQRPPIPMYWDGTITSRRKTPKNCQARRKHRQFWAVREHRQLPSLLRMMTTTSIFLDPTRRRMRKPQRSGRRELRPMQQRNLWNPPSLPSPVSSSTSSPGMTRLTWRKWRRPLDPSTWMVLSGELVCTFIEMFLKWASRVILKYGHRRLLIAMGRLIVLSLVQ